MVKGKDVDLTDADAMASDLADADLVLIDDGAAGTQASTKKSALSRFWTYILGKLSAVTDVSSYSWVLAEDTLSSDSDTKVPTQGSVKAYVDAQVSGSGNMSSFTVSATTDSNATTITNGEDLFFADGTRINCETTADGTVTISTTATTNDTDANLKARANHTGTQAASTISDFDAEVANNSAVTANTAKVSADGLVTTHSDVTSAGSGAIITTDERTKLGVIEDSADVTDSTNVTSSLVAATGISGSDKTTIQGNLGVDPSGTDNSTDVTLTGTPDYITISGQIITRNAIDLAADVTGTLPVANGGTGSTSFTDKSVVITQDAGTDTLSSLDLSTAGQIIIGGSSGPAAANIAAGSGITITNSNNSIQIATTGASQTAGDGLDLSGSEFSLDLKSNGGLVIESTEVAVDLGASSITGTLAVSDGGTGATSLTNDGVLTGGGTSAITSESNVKVSQGTLHVSNATSSASGGVRFLEAADNGTAYTTLQAAADNLNSNPVITMPASTGTMALTSDIPVHTAGDGLTLTGVDFDIDAAQTTITSVLNANLKIGTAATDEYIDFGAVSNVIRMAVNNTTALDVTGSGIEVTGGVSVSGTNNVSCNGNVGDTANNDFVSFGTDGEVSLVTNNSARLTASDTGVSAANMNVTSELNSKKNIFEKTSNTDHDYQGDVVKFGSGTLQQGRLCYYSNGAWAAADSDAEASSGGCLLGISLGTSPTTDGLLIKGMYTMASDMGTDGDELYVSGSLGEITNTAPTGSGDIVRVVGYCLDSTNGQIWFNPSSDFIQLA